MAPPHHHESTNGQPDYNEEGDVNQDQRGDHEGYLAKDGDKKAPVPVSSNLFMKAFANAQNQGSSLTHPSPVDHPVENQNAFPNNTGKPSYKPHIPFKHLQLGPQDPVLPSIASSLAAQSPFTPKTEEQLADERALFSLRLVKEKASTDPKFSRFRKEEKVGFGERGDGEWSNDFKENLLKYIEEARRYSGGRGICIVGVGRMDVDTVKRFLDSTRDYISYNPLHRSQPAQEGGGAEYLEYIRGGCRIKRGSRVQILVVESLQLNRGKMIFAHADLAAHIAIYDLFEWAPETTRVSGIPLPLVDAFEAPFMSGKCTYFAVKNFCL